MLQNIDLSLQISHNNTDENDLTLHSFDSQMNMYPSPNQIYSQTNIQPQFEYKTPAQIKTPSPRPEDIYQEQLDNIGTLLDELKNNMQNRFDELQHKQNKTNNNIFSYYQQQDSQQLSYSSPSSIISNEEINSMQSPTSIRPTTIQYTQEHDSVYSSNYDNTKIIEDMVDQSINENLSIIKQNFNDKINNEMTLRRLESDVQLLIRSYYSTLK